MRNKQSNVDVGSGINKYLIRELKNKNIILNSVRTHRLLTLIAFFSQQFKLKTKYRFKLR